MVNAPSSRAARHPWPRALVRLRRMWFGVMETLSFFAAAAAAVGRVLIGRWPEPMGRDWLAPRPDAGRRGGSHRTTEIQSN